MVLLSDQVHFRLMSQKDFFPVRNFSFLVLFLCIAIFLTGCGGSVSASGNSLTGSNGGNGGTTSSVSAPRWHPVLSDTWQWQLRGTVNTGYAVSVYDVDLFDTPMATIQSLQAAGKKVVCYFSAGSSENWRSDFSQFQAADMGNNLTGWAGERWLDTRSSNVRQMMQARLDLAVAKGCNGVEPDNVDGYVNRSGFPLTAATQLDYNRFLANESHQRGLAIALKNDINQLSDLVGDFDFALNEQCHEFNECDNYQIFINNNKPVFNAEYASVYSSDPIMRQTLCADAAARRFHTLVLPLMLDDKYRYSCDL
ncbi:endo alpha-1,4 polygalactosaminidase [Undibacterium griseum]|nr:endo alpha-1,4 polygalactosaminidase [Undibacterium griseum]